MLLLTKRQKDPINWIPTLGTFCISQGILEYLFWAQIRYLLSFFKKKLNLLFRGLAHSDKNPYHM